jgi:acyl-homoserine-lactone acylase
VLRRVLPALLLLVGAVLALAFWPVDVEGEVAGLLDAGDGYDVEIVRDELGRPHIRGPRDVDVAHGLAWAHAEDDFGTIQMSLLAARGDLATRLGIDAAPNDYMVGLLRVREQVEAGWPGLSSAGRDVADAYADGLNLYAAVHPEEVEPGLFPVDGRDVVAQAVHKSPLFFGLEQVLGELFAPGPLELTRHDPGVPVPRADGGGDALQPGDLRHGSNTVAIAPSRSDDGATRLLVNSHQPWTGPVSWWEATVESEEGWHATGALFPGVPAIVHGHNERVGWAFTVNHADLVDVYELDVDPDDPDRYRVDGQWLELERRQVPIELRVLGRLEITVEREVLWSIFGPTIEREDGTFAVRYAGMGDVADGSVATFEQLHDLNRADDLDAWLAAMRDQDGLPTFTAGVADADGRIALVYNAMLPDRAPGHDWAGIVPGTTREVLWERYLPFDALPHTIDPASGWVQDANSSPFTATDGAGAPVPGDFPVATTGIERYETNRSLRLRSLLSADGAISSDDLRAIKLDRGYAPESDLVRWAERLVALAPADDPHERRALELLVAWPREAAVDADGMAVLAAVTAELDADEEVELPPGRLVGTEVSDAQLIGAFERGVAWLVEHHGTPDVAWGEVNRLIHGDVDLPLGGGPETIRAVYGRPTDDGRFRGVAGDSYVALVAWSAEGEVSSVTVHQFGAATDDPDDPHHDDQAPLFAAEVFTPTWFDADDLAAHVEQRYRPGP